MKRVFTYFPKRMNLKYIIVITCVSVNLTFSDLCSFSFSCCVLISAERLAEDLNASVPNMPSESASEGLAPKVASVESQIIYCRLPCYHGNINYLCKVLNGTG